MADNNTSNNMELLKLQQKRTKIEIEKEKEKNLERDNTK